MPDALPDHRLRGGEQARIAARAHRSHQWSECEFKLPVHAIRPWPMRLSTIMVHNPLSFSAVPREFRQTRPGFALFSATSVMEPGVRSMRASAQPCYGRIS
jgi:hypothetical protein